MSKKSNFVFSLFAVLCVLVGIYPLIYLFVESNFGVLGSKSQALLDRSDWWFFFYGHILFGGLALLTGWLQFVSKLRIQFPHIHKIVGYVYLIAVLISGTCAIALSFNATGGFISGAGFFGLGTVWLSSSILAFVKIRRGKIESHKTLMIYSFACCFAAVTLRVWLPIMMALTENFLMSYLVVSWLCWIPNLLVVYFFIPHKKLKASLIS